MFDPQMTLLTRVLARVCARLAEDPALDSAWAEAREALSSTRDAEPELATILDAKDRHALQSLVDEWSSGARHLPEQDREVLKRAMKAYRKSLKVTRLDAESSIAGGPMSSGRSSGIVAIVPPPRYPREVWDELVRQGRLLDAKHGMYELPPEQSTGRSGP